MKALSKTIKYILLTIGVFALSLALYIYLPLLFAVDYEADILSVSVDAEGEPLVIAPVFVASHIDTPESVKAVYMTSWIAGRKDLRERVLNLIYTTELNAIVIDIKDDTGRISFEIENPELKAYGSEEIRIADLRDFIADLHSKGIYVIGRISAFQDPYMTNRHPNWAVKRESDGGIWRDRKGLSWIDAGNREMWHYLALIGEESHNAGFDELNYDYVRYPSDGNMQDISFPHTAGKVKSDVMKDFFAYITGRLKSSDNPNLKSVPVVSADLFGMTTTASYGFDLGIGQIFEDAIYYFDFVAPMVYPSHYPPNFNGYPDPNKVPYEIIKIAMDGAVSKINALATTSPNYNIKKIRPWLQDFDYGGNYDVFEVRAQIRATYDAGLNSWMVWDPGNRYTRGAYLDN
jgi:hypothetical protein